MYRTITVSNVPVRGGPWAYQRADEIVQLKFL